MPANDSSRLQIIRLITDEVLEFSPRVYISYRPEDHPGVVRAIRDWFMLRLGPAYVVIDIDIPPFVGSLDYYIRERIRDCDIFVPIIGPDWERLLRENLHTSRGDRVRVEIRVALDERLVVAPVCILDAHMPREVDLPVDLRPLVRHHFSRLDAHRQFEENMARIIEEMRQAIIDQPAGMADHEVENRFVMAEERYAAGQLEEALALYEEIHDFGEVARPFRLQVKQRIRQIYRQQELAIGRPVYLRLQALAGEDSVLAREQFQIFRAEFPIHGDPDDLEHALYPDLHLVDHLLARLSNPEVDARERLAIGDELAASNDPRPGVGLRDDRLPDLSWAKVPAGEFIFHFDQRLELPTFYISKHPITYRQFQAFIKDGGFEEDAWWEGMSIRDGDPGDLRWPVANYPRVRVSWFDAVAFTRWLSARLGYEVRLPTEQEWEKAARGTIGTIYPWGDSYISGYSNINEVISGISPINLRQPTAVGVFPHAASNYGVHDMIGNVWEWCLNHFDDPLVTTVEGEDKRSMRGGAWSSDRLFAHTARRRGELPWTRFNDIGFRIACDQLPSLDARSADRE